MSKIKCFKFNEYKKVKLKSIKTKMVEIDCGKIKNKEEIYAIFSSTLNFPSYFGGNWEAFKDCLRDLGWINDVNILVIIKNPYLLKEDIFDPFIKVLINVSCYWTLEKRIFSVILLSDKQNYETIRSKVHEYEVEFNQVIKKFPNYFGAR